MKRFLYFGTILCFLFVFSSMIHTATAKTLYDDFLEDYVDYSKWGEIDFVREVNQGELLLKVGNSATELLARNTSPFIDPASVSTIECDISVVITNLDSGSESESSARVTGRFYNTQNSGTERGDIWVALKIGDRGSGLEAWWEAWEATDDVGDNWEDRGSGTLTIPGLTYNQVYTVKIEYDGTNEITFTVAGISDSFTGPTRQAPVFAPYKGLETLAWSDGGAGNGYISASFDNVFINNSVSAYDDFSTAPLDQTKWQRLEFIRETNNGKLRLTAHSDGEREQSRVGFAEISPYTEAIVTIKSDSQIETGDRGIARIDGYFYNDTYGPGSYNEYEGNVWAAIELDYRDGVLKAQCSGYKSLNADDTVGEDVFYREFFVPIIFDRPYKLSIHFTGSQMRFSCRDTVTGREDIYRYQIETSAYEPYEEYRALRSRVYGNAAGGYMVTEFDNVYVDVAEPPATYDATGDWEITDSDPWSELGCDLPDDDSTTDVTITQTQNGNDFTMVAHTDDGDFTFDGVVYGESYYFVSDVETEGDRELHYGVFHLSQALSGAGSFTSHFWDDDVYQCRNGTNFAITKDTDGAGDDGGGDGGGGGGCFISELNPLF